ncbi:MAG TPA: amidohydrolase [Ferruginibacter sp.]|nr:amidohydrolase [Ferruginibacter sp.]HNH21218.1 amidohydrolase [Ferruginibacter sp.]
MSTLTVTTIQTNLHWEEKSANLRMLEEKIAAIEERTELVVLPEMFSTGFSMKPSELAEDMEGETMAWMKRVSRENGIVLTGSFIATENAGYYNRLVWMLPNGQYGYYDKRHLFGYAGEDKHYQAGNKRLIASVNGWKINLQVCYDLRFPVWARNRVLDPDQNRAGAPASTTSPEYDLLVYVANWPERRSHAWKTLLCARAIENQCYVIGVNRVGSDGNNIYHSGNSLVIDPLGQVLYHMADQEDVSTITLQKEKLEEVREKFPFWKDADSFTIH